MIYVCLGMKMESLWINILFLLLISGQTSAQNVNLTFLSSVCRLNTNTTRDYYFCCNVEGGFIQWEYNNEPLSGFLPGDVGRVLVDERTSYTYTATLLSSQPTDNSQTKLDSILVISIANNMDPVNFTITCSSSLGVQSITSGATMDTVKNSNNATEEIQLDYVVSGHVVSTYSTTHIFICGVREPPQFIEVTGPALGFSNSDNVGQARTIFSDDGNTALVQGILIARESSQAVTLIFTVADADVMVSCYDRENRATLPSMEAKEPPKESPVDTTNIMMKTTVQLSQSSTKVTEETSSFTTSIIYVEAGTRKWLVPVVIMIVIVVIVIALIPIGGLVIIFSAIHYMKRRFSKPVSIKDPLKMCELGISSNYRDRNGDQFEFTNPSSSLVSQAQLLKQPVQDSSFDRMLVAQASDHVHSSSSFMDDESDLRSVDRGVESNKPIKPDCGLFAASVSITAEVEVRQITETSKKIEDGTISEKTLESQRAVRKPDSDTAKLSMQETSSWDENSNVSYVVVDQGRIYHLNHHCKVIERPSVDSPGLIIAEVAPVADSSKTVAQIGTASSNQVEASAKHDECKVIERPSVDSPGLIIAEVAPVADSSKTIAQICTASSNQVEASAKHDECSSIKSD